MTILDLITFFSYSYMCFSIGRRYEKDQKKKK